MFSVMCTGFQCEQRVEFTSDALAHRSLSGNAPSHLADDCCPVTDAVPEDRARPKLAHISSIGRARQQSLRRCRTATLEQFAAWTQTARLVTQSISYNLSFLIDTKWLYLVETAIASCLVIWKCPPLRICSEDGVACCKLPVSQHILTDHIVLQCFDIVGWTM